MRVGIAASLLAGCYNPTISGGSPCVSDTDCPAAFKCVEKICGGIAVVVDAAPHDAPDAFVMPDAPPDGIVVTQHVIGDDPAEIRDAEIWGGTDEINMNFGTGDHVSIDAAESGLFWFDLTSIPAGKTVMAATLRVHVSDNASEGGGDVTIHRLREAWVETETTWLARAAAQSWATSGARSPSSDTASIGSFLPAALDTNYDIPLPIAMVQEWIDNPAVNFGIVIIQGSSMEHVHLYARETNLGSKLTIDVY